MLFFLLLGVGLAESAIIRDSCQGDGSVEPNCRDHLTPELEGLSFYLPHEYGGVSLSIYIVTIHVQTVLSTGSVALTCSSACLSVLLSQLQSAFTLTIR